MSTYPKIETTIELTDNGMNVIVTHHVRQSFSRAVDPAAIRAATAFVRANGYPSGLAFTDADYGFEGIGPDRCRSRLIFTKGE